MTNNRFRRLLAVAGLLATTATAGAEPYEQSATRELVGLVDAAAELVRTRGTDAFAELRRPGSQWRHDEKYIFVLDPAGTMLVHPDPGLEGRNTLDLKDVNGKPIIRGLIQAATAKPGKAEGWYHYEWPVPGGLLPRWKSSFVRNVSTPSGEGLIVGAGMYDDAIERAFVVDAVTNAAAAIEAQGETAFAQLRDPTGPYVFKDVYVFVVEPDGVQSVNPAFPNLEGRNVMDVTDTEGKRFVRDFFATARSGGAGWVQYQWPRPGEAVSTLKSTYVQQARLGDRDVLVGCGVYLANAPRSAAPADTMTAPQLMALVRDAARVFEERGEAAYPGFRKRGTRWFDGETYFFVWNMQGLRVFHAAEPEGEGLNVSNLEDTIGRPIGRLFIETAGSQDGEGWVHYLYPLPGGIFPTWKSTFIKRVTFPSGATHLIGSGIYNMEMDEAFITDVVDRAAALIAAKGRAAFPELRDRRGAFVFMDTYVFVDDTDGNELVNGAQPSMEGKNLMAERDVQGRYVVRDYIGAALRDGSTWIDYYWYRPGENTPSLKRSYVRKVPSGNETFIVGAGLYPRDAAGATASTPVTPAVIEPAAGAGGGSPRMVE